LATLSYEEKVEIYHEHMNRQSHIFSDSERDEITDIVFEGIPEDSRVRFWHKCLGIQSYKQNYIQDYYSTLCEADGSGAWE
jgi:hypothetical protein